MSIDSAFATRTLTVQLQELLYLDEQRRAEALDALVEIDPDMTDQLRKILFDDQWADFLEPDENSTGPILVRQLFDRLKECDEPDPIPEQLGPYRILSRLGVGGMGEVYLAEDQAPFERHIALKVLKTRHSWDGDRAKALLEQEIQSQAGLDHAYIPKIYSSGVLPDNRVYFAMELIRGVPITEYCDRFKLTLRERLRLVSKVCDALSHCHAMLRVHGDLKPSNILVTLPSDVSPGGEPRIIDFGIAQRLDTKRDRPSGTIQYMAPEQAERNGVASVSNDVYGIGAVLHHVLVGFPPVIADKPDDNFEYLKSRRLRPSEVLNEREDLEDIVEARGEKSKSLMSKLRAELDVLVLKAIDPDFQKRFDSIASLKRDISDYLSDRPISVVPRYSFYRTFKMRLRRDLKGVLLEASLALIALTVSFFLWRVWIEKNKTDLALRDAQKIEEFYQLILNKPHPYLEGPDIKFLDVVFQAEELLKTISPERPDLKSRVQHTIGVIYLQLGDFKRAKVQLEQALENAEDDFRPRIMLNLGRALREEDPNYALELFQNAYEQSSLANDGSLSSIDFYDNVKILALINLSFILQQLGDFSCAIYYAEDALSFSQDRDNADVLGLIQSKEALGSAYAISGFRDRAIFWLESANHLAEKELGFFHSETFAMKISLSSVYYRANRIDQSIKIAKECLNYYVSSGSENVNLAKSLYILGLTSYNSSNYSQAFSYAVEALDIQKKYLGEKSIAFLKTSALLASIRGARGEHLKAAMEYEYLVNSYSEMGLLSTREGLFALNNLGHQYMKAGYYGDALFHLHRSLDLKEDFFGVFGRSTLITKATIAQTWHYSGFDSEAERIYQYAKSGIDANLPDDRWLRGVIRYYLGIVCLDVKKYMDAECLLKDAQVLLESYSSYQNAIYNALKRLDSETKPSRSRQETL